MYGVVHHFGTAGFELDALHAVVIQQVILLANWNFFVGLNEIDISIWIVCVDVVDIDY
jgi:hypothetical protein